MYTVFVDGILLILLPRASSTGTILCRLGLHSSRTITDGLQRVLDVAVCLVSDTHYTQMYDRGLLSHCKLHCLAVPVYYSL